MRVQNFQGLCIAANTALMLVIQQKPGGRLPKRALRSNAVNIRLAHIFQPSDQVPFCFFSFDHRTPGAGTPRPAMAAKNRAQKRGAIPRAPATDLPVF
jgi:hypothetical protein